MKKRGIKKEPDGELNDSELLDKILSEGKDGSKAAAKLYKRYERELMDFYLSKTHNREDAEDLWQDLWTIIFRKPKYFRDSMTMPMLKTLIMRIATNQIADYQRGKIVREDTVNFSDITESTEEDDYSTEEKIGMKSEENLVLSDYSNRYNRKNIVRIISRAIKGDSRKAKSVLWRKLVGFTNLEISLKTGLSVKTVKNTYSELAFLARKELERNGMKPDKKKG